MPRRSFVRPEKTGSSEPSTSIKTKGLTAFGLRFAALSFGALVTASCTTTPEKPISADPKVYKSGTVVKDCVDCPKMVVVEPGSFEMGSRRGETDEKPRREVRIPHGFAVGMYEVTFREWTVCVEEGGCSHMPEDENWGKALRPLVNVSWNDAQDYISWLNRKTGLDYRLLSEAEWEYAARAESSAIDISGQGIGNCRYCYSETARSSDMTVPVGQYPPNAFKVHDMLGNVWEWTADCYLPSYRGAPSNGAAREKSNCETRSIRGGSWKSFYGQTRAANRGRAEQDVRRNDIGFRVARTVLIDERRETAKAGAAITK